MKPDQSYQINFSGLGVGKHTFAWNADATLLSDHGVERFSRVDLEIKLLLHKKERLMELDFEIDGKLETDCDRCLDPVTIEFVAREHLVVKFAHDNDFTDDEVVFIDEFEHTLDLKQFIYEFVIVGLPGRIVHEDGECNPEVARFLDDGEKNEGRNENDIDPRWEALKKLKNQSS